MERLHNGSAGQRWCERRVELPRPFGHRILSPSMQVLSGPATSRLVAFPPVSGYLRSRLVLPRPDVYCQEWQQEWHQATLPMVARMIPTTTAATLATRRRLSQRVSPRSACSIAVNRRSLLFRTSSAEADAVSLAQSLSRAFVFRSSSPSSVRRVSSRATRSSIVGSLPPTTPPIGKATSTSRAEPDRGLRDLVVVLAVLGEQVQCVAPGVPAPSSCPRSCDS
jgi:hypothetical protein